MTTYAQFVESRFKGGIQTAVDLQLCSPQEAQLLHVAMGLVGELGEYRHSESRANMLEELGDFGFFLQAGANVLGDAPLDFVTTGETGGVQDHVSNLNALDISTIEFMDIVKKTVIYRKPLQLVTLRTQLQIALFAYAQVCAYHGTTPQELQIANTEKLTKRYATGYSNQAAQDRADKA